jgi:hypothetical protein
MGRSIFEFADIFGIVSPLADEVPDVNSSINKVSTLKSIPNVTLLDCDKNKYYPINKSILLSFKLDGNAVWIGGETYSITIESTNAAITLTTKSFSVEKGWKFSTYVKSDKITSGTLKVSVNGVQKKTINVQFKSNKDIFSSSEIAELLIENKEAQKYDRNNDVPGNGYCIVAADRGLGALLDKKDDFYQEEVGKRIRLENAVKRANQLIKKGYILRKKPIINYVKAYGESPHPNYTIGVHAVTTDNYHNNNKPTKLNTSIRKSITKDYLSKELGFSVYYFTMHGQYHVMLLVIDHRDLCDIKYSILDQGYITDKVNMDISTLDDTFLELMKKFWNNKKQNAKYILLWKIKK